MIHEQEEVLMERNKKRSKIYFFVYIAITLLLLVDITAIIKWQISLVGYWSDRLVFWLWLLTTFAFLVYFWKSILTKIYLFVLILGVVLSIAPMMLPFYGILFSSTGMDRRSHFTPEHGKYRIQLIESVMARPRLQVIENKGILEKVVLFTDADFLKNNDLKVGYESILRLDVLKDTPDSLTLKFYTPSEQIVKSFKRNEYSH